MQGITLFTPTYNRANELLRCYNSIVSQSYEILEWIIIDDGSTDNTKDVIEKIIEENKLDIGYYFQENSGKQAAWNKAVDLAKYDLFIGVDSDDALNKNALTKIQELFTTLNNEENIAGIRAISVNSNTYLPDSIFLIDRVTVASWFDEFCSGKSGERIDLFKTGILKENKYPVSNSVKFVPEIWLYSHLSLNYKFIYTPKVVGVFYTNNLENRLSKSPLSDHTMGHFLARKKLLESMPLRKWIRNPIKFLKTIIRLNQVVRILNLNSVEFSKKMIIIFLLPALLLNLLSKKND
ncbi:glycosyltransferase family 2 protein [Vibrio sp. 1151_11]|uniref:glycosyltransferase family 2 protein n=1 Tax=Vibrio sp. 1151_11 TaxID=2527670 RepID=UPI00240769DA|nr:glycosyltransferase family 2 protein [Vibrio sp. 1151_11]MDF9388210.1 glycosyltransferase family 2 protein [Vibrio sp. 1151_11]